MLRQVIAGAICAFSLAASSSARTQDVAAAEELYRRGVIDFRAGRFGAACPEIANSYEIDPRPGALFTLATCEARLGRIATAAAHYEDFVQIVSRLPSDQRAKEKERTQAALNERAGLLPDIPYLTIAITGAPPHGTVRCDGATLGDAAIGQELPVDPGEHSITVELPSGTTQEQRIFVAKREHKTVEFQSAIPSPSPPGSPSPTGLAETPTPYVAAPGQPPPSDARARTSATVPWLYLSGSVGVTGTAFGTVMGLLALQQKRVTDSHCNGPACDATGKAAADKGSVEALASTIALGVGIGGLATLAIVYLTCHSTTAIARSQAAMAQEPHAGVLTLVLTQDTVGMQGRF